MPSLTCKTCKGVTLNKTYLIFSRVNYTSNFNKLYAESSMAIVSYASYYTTHLSHYNHYDFDRSAGGNPAYVFF